MTRCFDTCCTGDRDEIEYALISTTVRRARTPHRCSDCGTTIEPGTRYRRIVEKVDGEMYARLECLAAPYCAEAHGLDEIAAIEAEERLALDALETSA